MTSNQERAAEVIYPWIDGNYGDQDESSKAAAQALVDAGLITPDLSAVTRLTVVGGGKRQMEEWNLRDIELDIQDEGRTLKIFYRTDATQEKK